MKRLLAIVAVMFSVEAFAFDGSANSKIDQWKTSKQYFDGDTDNFNVLDFMNLARIQGLVAGFASTYDVAAFDFAICYPKDSDLNQATAVATNYILANPEKWDDSNGNLVWEAHFKVWGLRDDPECWSFEINNAS